MYRLPRELLEIVVSSIGTGDDYASREDLKSLRLVTKTLTEIAAVPLFRTLPLWISLKSLQNLSDIADHPQL